MALALLPTVSVGIREVVKMGKRIIRNYDVASL